METWSQRKCFFTLYQIFTSSHPKGNNIIERINVQPGLKQVQLCKAVRTSSI